MAKKTKNKISANKTVKKKVTLNSFKTTADFDVSSRIVDQVIGQEHAVDVIKKAALQRRHVLLIGEPGTGKSMLGLALAELIPKKKLVDILSFANHNDDHKPLIRTIKAGTGRRLTENAKLQSIKMLKGQSWIILALAIVAMIVPWWIRQEYNSDIMFAAFFIGGIFFLAAVVMFLSLNKRMSFGKSTTSPPKIIVDNYNKKQAPFYDATGAHAGALLGDVLHDPFQCFLPSTKISFIEDNIHKSAKISEKVDLLFNKYKNSILHKKLGEDNYEAIFLNRNELSIIGKVNGSLFPVEVLSCNRQDYKGKMIKLTTKENKNIIVTPEHKLAINENGKIKYKEAKDIKVTEEVFSKQDSILIDELDIINTYDTRQQEQCRLYYQYLEIKNKNPLFGYKRIAKLMNQPIGKTRWWHSNKHIPVPIQTANWLKERGLLPLKINNSNLAQIAKILGTTFGDGGIFQNLNGIFLSSSEIEAVKEFGTDIETIFSLSKNQNSRIIEGGEYGHSWCYQNTNRNIIRFFLALGTPKGNKTKIGLVIPKWVYLKQELIDEFMSSFFGSEIGIPKLHKQKNRLQTFDLGITGTEETGKNRLEFLNKIKRYLESKNIESTSILKRNTSTKGVYLYRLMISVKFDNVVRFIKNIKINYCDYKNKKLITAINNFANVKKEKYQELIDKGYGAEYTMKLLKLTPNSLYTILNEEVISA